MLNEDMTGADLYSICSNAWLSAVRRTILNHLKGKLVDRCVVCALPQFVPRANFYFHKLRPI